MESHSIEYWQMPGHESFIIPSSKKNLPKGNDIDSDDALRQYFFEARKKGLRESSSRLWRAGRKS